MAPPMMMPVMVPMMLPPAFTPMLTPGCLAFVPRVVARRTGVGRAVIRRGLGQDATRETGQGPGEGRGRDELM